MPVGPGPTCGATNALPRDTGTMTRSTCPTPQLGGRSPSLADPQVQRILASVAEAVAQSTKEMRKLVRAAQAEGSAVADSELMEATERALFVAHDAQALGYDTTALLAEVGGAADVYVKRKAAALKKLTDNAKKNPDPPDTDDDVLGGIKALLHAVFEADKLGLLQSTHDAAMAQAGASMSELIDARLKEFTALRNELSRSDNNAMDDEIIGAISDMFGLIQKAQKLDVEVPPTTLQKAGAAAGVLATALFNRNLGVLKDLLELVKAKKIKMDDDEVRAAASKLVRAKQFLVTCNCSVPPDGGLVAVAEGLLSAAERLDLVRETNRALGLDK